MWNAEKCNLCGDCLTKCLYIDYNKEKAVAEIKLLTEGKDAEILNKCVTCFACNEYCPTKADPFDLIIKMQEKTRSSPLLLSPGFDGFLDMVDKMPSEIIPGDPDKPILSLCVMEAFTPAGAIEGEIFKGMTVVKGRDYFCWLGVLHSCRESLFRENIGKFIDTMSKLNKEIVFIHEDCNATVQSLVKDYGISVPFKYTHIFEYLRNYLRDHKSSITKLGKKIAYQRPCASRYTHETENLLDEIFELIGVERVPRRYDRENAICCSGAYSGAFPELGAEVRMKNISDAIENGSEALVTFCAGCDGSLREPASQLGLQTVYLTNLCRMALGEIPWNPATK